MARYIDAEVLLENLKKQYGEDLGWQYPVNMSDVGMMIEDAPTADVVEVKHGYWIYHFDDLFPSESTQECSVCHEEDMTICNENYCPNCGAKMDGRRDT